MPLRLIVAGLIILAYADGQDICNYDPDGIFFENSQLEELRKAIQRGDCSSADVNWKLMDYGMQSSSGDRKLILQELSTQDRKLLKELTDYLSDGDDREGSRVRFPEDTRHSPDIFSEPRPDQSNYLQNLAPPKDSHIFSKINGVFRPQSSIKKFRSQSKIKRQTQQSDFFNSIPSFQRQQKLFASDKQNNFSPSDFRNEKGRRDQRRPQDLNDNGRFRPIFDDFTGTPLKPTNQRRPQNQDLFVPNSQNAPDGFISADDLFKPNKQRSRQTGPNRRQQSPNPTGGLFRPNDQSSSSQRERRPNNQRRPQNDSPPVTQRPQTTTPRVESTTLPGPPTWPTAPSLCVQRCATTREYNPICGSDSVTYNNLGWLRCERQCGKANLNVNHYGTCRITTDQSFSTTPTPAARTTRRRTSRNLAPSLI